MDDILELQRKLRMAQGLFDRAAAALEAAKQALEDAKGDGPPGSVGKASAEVTRCAEALRAAKLRLDAASAAYDAAVAADPLQALDPALPLVLLPVRIETAYLDNADGSTDLVVRVYPDDLHVDAHEPELTPDELAAGTAYWSAVWGAGPNAARIAAAWQRVLALLSPARAAWAVQALRPASPRPAVETPVDQPQPAPPLPAVPARPGSFNRPAQTTLLPDHWQVIGIRSGVELFNVAGAPIPDTLEVSFGPPGSAAPEGDLPFGPGSRWLVDLDAALAVGMAVRIPISGPVFTVSQLFVLGVSLARPPDEAARRLETTVTAHQFTRGLAFLPPGTPTNNTSATRSAWQSAALPPAPDAVEQALGSYAPGSRQNAALLATAFGIDGSAVLCCAPRGLDDQRSAAQALHQQLWPALGGETLFRLRTQWDIPDGSAPAAGSWQRHDDPATTAALREHVVGWVHGPGPLPVLRVGNQPYGLLPASALADWVAAPGDAGALIVPPLRDLRCCWQAGVDAAPHVRAKPRPGDDPDSTIVQVLQRLPVSETVFVRQDDGNPSFPLAAIPGLPMTSALYYQAPAADATPLRVRAVDDAGADHNFMLFLRDFFAEGLAVLKAGAPWADWHAKYLSLFDLPPSVPGPRADLLNALFADSFLDPLSPDGLQMVSELADLGLRFPTQQNSFGFTHHVDAFEPRAKALIAQLDAACAIGSTDEGLQAYDPLLRGILDLYAHRYDAWVTSLAARRLEQMRAAQPAGVALGAYGFVENLDRGTFTPADPVPGFPSVFGGPHQCYVHAPSMQHAATAAVLHAGFDSHGDGATLAVNLRSDRVRTADALATGLRNGQTLGALLGYRFERGLHAEGLDRLLPEFRNVYRLPQLPVVDSANGTAAQDAIAARDVVDGLGLYRQRILVKQQFEDSRPAEAPAIGRLLDDLAQAVDSLGDLLLAESVHHLVAGNALRSGTAADALGRGGPVPDRFDVVRTPRGGRSLSWQLGALMPASFTAAASGWNGTRPRALLEPRVEAWARSLLGDAARWQFVCSVSGVSAQPSQVSLGLDTLQLSALDVVIESAGAASQLERRVVDAVAAGQPPGSVIALLTAPAGDAGLGFAELAALAGRMRTLLAAASPLGPQQWQGADAVPVEGLDSGELAARVDALAASYTQAVAALAAAAQALRSALAGGSSAALASALGAARAALVGVADHGQAGTYPPAPNPAADPAAESGVIAGLADAVLARAQSQASGVADPVPPPGAPAAQVQPWLAATIARAQAITGTLLPLLPVYRLTAGSPAARALAREAAPLGADGPALMAWLRRIARVRRGGAALHDVLLAAESLDAGTVALGAVQLPPQSGARWVGLPFADAPPAARLASVFMLPALVDPAAPVCGLLFDRWAETLPGLTGVAGRGAGYESAEVTGIAYTAPVPDACAPQAILLAVAPNPQRGWSLDILFDVVQETLELAKLRSLDLGDVARAGRVLPAIHSGSNLDALIAAAEATP